VRRDPFPCQYCGAKAPDVVLQCDHIKPVVMVGRCESNGDIPSPRFCFALGTVESYSRRLSRWLLALDGCSGQLRRFRLPANYWTTSTRTLAIPLSTIPSSLAAEPETSTTRPGMYGPRSLTRTVTDRPVATFVTRNRVPNGKVRWAAVNSCVSNFSPLAVCWSSV